MIDQPLYAQAKAAIIAEFIGDNFLEAARHFRQIQDNAPELFATVVELTGIGMRKAYYLAQIDRQFSTLAIDRMRLHHVGWTKLQVIGPYVTKGNCHDLLCLAEAHTVYELATLMRGEEPHPDARCVQLYLSPEQYEVFEVAVVANGGIKSGRRLFGKEAALTSALLRTSEGDG